MGSRRNNRRGIVYLVGAGPGDPGLLTLRGRDCIAQSDRIVYDYLANDALLRYARKEAERIFAGKHGGGRIMPQEEINHLLISSAREGKVVTRLKGGDPFIFGRGGEEAEALVEAGIPFEVVPGVTAAIAAPAYAGIPLTHRDFSSSIAFITGYEDPQKIKSQVAWDKIATGVETLVIFMGMKKLQVIVDQLIRHGRAADTPVALIRWGTLPVQQTLTGTLTDIVGKAEGAGFKPPVMVVIGEIVRLRDKIRWFETRPLHGKKVVVTRDVSGAASLVRLLSAYGAEVVEFPTLELHPPESWEPVDRAIEELQEYDWVLFTSANGVRFFMERVRSQGRDSRSLGGLKVSAVGPKTAEALRGWGITPDLVPEEFRAEGVLDAFRRWGFQGKKILFPRAKEGREILPEGLTRMGADVTLIPVYQVVKPRGNSAFMRALLREGHIDAVTFTSPATARNFVDLLDGGTSLDLLSKVTIACISPVTADAVKELGLTPAVVAPEATVESLAESLASHFIAA